MTPLPNAASRRFRWILAASYAWKLVALAVVLLLVLKLTGGL